MKPTVRNVARPLLLDTCAALWLMDGAPLSAKTTDAIDLASDRNEPVYVSPFMAWEIGKLAECERLPATVTPQVWFKSLTSLSLIRLADLTPEILIQSSCLPGKAHKDPADRILIATARELAMTIVTRDRLILDYAARGYVAAIAC